MDLRNTYWLLRHGRSRANERGIIVSSVEEGEKEEFGLTELGHEQASAAGAQWLQLLGKVESSDLSIISSPFSRARQTAEDAAASASVKTASIEIAEELRERYFGTGLELQSDKGYQQVWAADAIDSSTCPSGGGESVEQVSCRLKQLVQRLEMQHQGIHILLVSHGDTLSIMWATMTGSPLPEHRAHGQQTGELRKLQTQGC
ncbi:hypothetical protein WJX74_005468 [Apatococcus lobatus]|uniref:Phosphoglycerate mutase n=1 Tax=Apatococcus lobatus TaxID=904363 RepID=A0AAW1RFB3_9CHLO